MLFSIFWIYTQIFFEKVKKGVDRMDGIWYNLFCSERTQAPIAQLDRAFDYESKGHRFESCWVHHEPPIRFALSAVVFYLRNPDSWRCSSINGILKQKQTTGGTRWTSYLLLPISSVKNPTGKPLPYWSFACFLLASSSACFCLVLPNRSSSAHVLSFFSSLISRWWQNCSGFSKRYNAFRRQASRCWRLFFILLFF